MVAVYVCQKILSAAILVGNKRYLNYDKTLLNNHQDSKVTFYSEYNPENNPFIEYQF
jgi:hypothetical protein